MSRSPSSEVTELLLAWSQGEQAALDKLIPLVHRGIKPPGASLFERRTPRPYPADPALVNEVYLRLVDSSQVRWQDRAHFMAVSAQLMRRILVDFARTRKYLKRGGGAQQVTLDEATVILQKPDADLVALDDALNALSAADPRMGQVVELVFGR